MSAKTWTLRGWCWTLACVTGLSPLAASAAEPKAAVSALEAEVVPLVERGIEQRRLGQDAQALLLFEAALEKTPESARVRVHIAMTHQALGQWLEADRYLRQLLREVNDPYVKRHRAELVKASEFVARHTGSLDVAGEPLGAEVWLSGQSIGRLPLAEPVRMPVGAYVLEVVSPNHFSVSRPIVITAGGFLRESVTLAPRERSASALAAAESSLAPPGVEPAPRSPRWLTWTLAGLGAGAAITSGIAIVARENHAEDWNSNECLAPELTRGQVCPEELAAGQTAETVAITSGIISGIFLAGALTSYLLETPAEERPDAAAASGPKRARASRTGALSCGLGWAAAGCRGTF